MRTHCLQKKRKHGNIFKLYVYRYFNIKSFQVLIDRQSEPGVTVFWKQCDQVVSIPVFGFIVCIKESGLRWSR